ncbi:hypothetical protein AgCh_040163 [Apium graveolens]
MKYLWRSNEVKRFIPATYVIGLSSTVMKKKQEYKEGHEVLTWEARMKVILGTAVTLAYLYQDIEPMVVHWDIKASNILIDHEFNSKVSYFGLTKLLESEVSLKTKEIIGLHDITESVKIMDVPQPPVQNLDKVGTARILDISEAINESRSVNEAAD